MTTPIFCSIQAWSFLRGKAARASEFDAVTKAYSIKPVVDELAAAVHIQRLQGKGRRRECARSVSDHEGFRASTPAPLPSIRLAISVRARL